MTADVKSVCCFFRKASKMKITSLIDNVSYVDRIDFQHGLSLYIETEKLNILFDMGQDDLFIRNAQNLELDISKVDIAIISHGHYDHGGGLKYFLDINKKAPVYINKYAFGSHYNAAGKYIGLDNGLIDNKRLKFVEKDLELSAGIRISIIQSDEIKYNIEPCGLTVKTDDGFFNEDFKHEQYLVIEDCGKKILFSGCSHKGILNIVEKYKPDYLVGGFHFSKIEDESKLKSYASQLENYDTKYFTGHCTGIKQFEILSENMSKLNYLPCGDSVFIHN